jgi:HEAT repeat protein
VPATILDQRLVLIGNTTAGRLQELVKLRGTPEYEREVVQSLIDTGRIAEAAGCLGQDAGREVILAFIQDPEFSRRLSGLVVVEKALEDNPGMVRALVPSLAEMLSHEDARIRGDIADLLGRTGDPQVIARLEPLVTDPNPDVAEAAADAIEELRKIH